tara:strand:+ start:2299 stop:2685 length:387 start_codon:yes stop_codon:yes gene_type:complete
MIKGVLTNSIVLFIVFFIGFLVHTFFIESQQIKIPFSLKKVYLFHLSFSVVLCINFLVFSSINKVYEQLGFIYLGSILLKITLFCVLFHKSIFTEEELPLSSRVSLFIPVILFLATEAIIVAKILKKK